jgi:hypothetical protein
VRVREDVAESVHDRLREPRVGRVDGVDWRTSIRGWERRRVSNEERRRKKKDKHLEILRLKDESQVEELAGGEDEL